MRGTQRHRMDKLLNLLDRIAYAWHHGLLTIEELSNFGWYLIKIREDDDLKPYCEKYFPDVIKAAEAYEKVSPGKEL